MKYSKITWSVGGKEDYCRVGGCDIMKKQNRKSWNKDGIENLSLSLLCNV